MMQIHTKQEKHFNINNFQEFSREIFTQTLHKWFKQSKKNRKQHVWNSLFFNLSKVFMPDLKMNQLILDQDFFIQKIYHLINLSNIKIDDCFHGIQIKLNQALVIFDNSCKLQKIVIEDTQIKLALPTESFTLIKQVDMRCRNHKQKLVIYNRQQNCKSIYLTVQIKEIQKTKHQIFKQDHSNKLKFFINFIFGDYCPTFCASTINILEFKQNQLLRQKTHFLNGNIYFIYSGTLTCFLQNNDFFKSLDEEEFSEKQSPQNQVEMCQLNQKFYSINQSPPEFINKIELSKGSIIDSSTFLQVLIKLDQKTLYKSQSCKSLSKLVLFQIKSKQFLKALLFDQRCKTHFLSHYQKILLSRKLLFSQSFKTINKNLQQNQLELKQTQVHFSFPRKSNYKGFRRSQTVRNHLKEAQNLATIQIYQTIIKSKQKVLDIQKIFKQKSKKLQKTNILYEDNKKIKQNYKRMKIKDYHIQKLVFSNYQTNVKDPEGFNNIKKRFGQVRGMFEDEVDDLEKAIHGQRQPMPEFQSTNQQMQIKKTNSRLLEAHSSKANKAYLNNRPQTSSKASQKSKRTSFTHTIFSNNFYKEINQTITQKEIDFTNSCANSSLSIQNEFKKREIFTPSNEDQNFSRWQSNECKQEQNRKSFCYSPLKCINNILMKDLRNNNKKAKTYQKFLTARVSYFNKEAAYK